MLQISKNHHFFPFVCMLIIHFSFIYLFFAVKQRREKVVVYISFSTTISVGKGETYLLLDEK